MKRVSLPSAPSSWTSCRTRFHSFLYTRCSNPVGSSRGLSRCQDDTRRWNTDASFGSQARMSAWRSFLGGFGVILNAKRDVAYSASCHLAFFLHPESPVWSYTPLSLSKGLLFPLSFLSYRRPFTSLSYGFAHRRSGAGWDSRVSSK